MPFSLKNMHSIGLFFSAYFFGLLKYSRKSKRLTALVACVPLVQKDYWALSILISVNWILGRIKSSRFIRSKVDFHGNPTSILYFFHEKFISAWNLVLSRSSQCFGSASEPIKLQETIYPVLVVARTDYSCMVKRHLCCWCNGFSQPIIMLISCAWWGVLRALLSLLSCGLHSICFLFCLVFCCCFFVSKRFYDQLTSGFRISNVSGFRILYQSRFRIPIHWVPDSKLQNFVHSGFREETGGNLATRRGAQR